MKALYSMLVFAVFALGIGAGALITLPQVPAGIESYTTTSRALNVQNVAGEQNRETAPLTAIAQNFQLSGPVEQNSPGDWIKESQIEMRSDGVFIKLNNPQWAILADTNSMDPVFDTEAHLIQIVPLSASEIRVGDIVSYESPLGFSIVHRVIEIGSDEEGWYAILQGDNNPQPDPWKVRFDMVRRVTVMVVY